MRLNLIEKTFYKKGVELSFEEATAKSLLFLEYVNMTREWQEDEGYFCDYWYGIADNWDLNIFYPDPDADPYLYRVCLYPVIDGECEYNIWRTIYPCDDTDLLCGKLPPISVKPLT
jgi:hypothetical protein